MQVKHCVALQRLHRREQEGRSIKDWTPAGDLKRDQIGPSLKGGKQHRLSKNMTQEKLQKKRKKNKKHKKKLVTWKLFQEVPGMHTFLERTYKKFSTLLGKIVSFCKKKNICHSLEKPLLK